MDARYVSDEKKILNSIISKVNDEIKSNLQIILSLPQYKKSLMEIASEIYRYAGLTVSVETYFTEKNDADPVLLPLLSQDIVPNPASYKHLMQRLLDSMEAAKDEFSSYALYNLISVHYAEAIEKTLLKFPDQSR